MRPSYGCPLPQLHFLGSTSDTRLSFPYRGAGPPFEPNPHNLNINVAFNFGLRHYIEVAVVEVSIALGGYSAATFGDTEKTAFTNGIAAAAKVRRCRLPADPGFLQLTPCLFSALESEI